MYIPDRAFSGTATFTYTLSDTNGKSDTGQVTLQIGSTRNGNNRNDVFTGNGGDDNFTGGNGNDRLTGQAGNDFLDGGRGKDTLRGKSGSDTLVGGQADDLLTGGTGNDTFVLTTLKDSLLSGFDRITDLTIGFDRIDAPKAIAAGQVVNLGAVGQLKAVKIADILTVSTFAADSAATFTLGSGRKQQTFLALNNGTAGFSAKTDSLIDITGYNGNLADLAIG